MRYDLRVTRMGNLGCEKSKQTGYSKLASLKVVLTTYREIACVITITTECVSYYYYQGENW